MRVTNRSLAFGAMVAALYVVLTLASYALNLSSGLIQLRLSEALCVLPFFSMDAVWGLFVGCVLANIVTGSLLFDIIFGSIATLLAALMTYWIGRRGLSKWFAPLPAVVTNAAIVGTLLVYAYGVEVNLFLACLYVALGQTVACYGLGMQLMLFIKRISKSKLL